MNKAVMDALTKRAGPALTRRVSRQKLVLKKQSPHIMFGVGIVGTVASTVLACRATLKLSDTLGEIEEDISDIRELRDRHERAKANGDTHPYSSRDLNRDTAYIYGKAAYLMGKLYGPAVGVGIVSITLLTGSHVAMTRRNTALIAAYSAVAKAYDDYRARVIQELGAEKELDLYHAKVASQVTNAGDEVSVVDPNQWSPYAKFFDEGSSNWEKDAELNRLFIQCQQNYANELLRARGHLFLNEVYDMLGLDRTGAGAVVGWVIGDKGDNFVDFGMYEAANAQFINGWEPRVILDFNVDGVIFDKI